MATEVTSTLNESPSHLARIVEGARHHTGREPAGSLGKPAVKSEGYAVIEAKGKLQPWTVELPDLGPLDIEIMPTHNGVCHSDIHMRDNDWGVSFFPFIPGHEIVGIVRAIGTQVTCLRPGDRVGVGFVCDCCRCCSSCIRGEEQLCKGHTTLMVGGRHGGLQSALRVRADFAFKIPDGLESAHAAPLLCAGITAFAPLRRYMTRPGMHVCILGIGGVGHLALQFANVMGGIVTAATTAAEKQQECIRLGAHTFEVYDDSASGRLASQFDIILNCASVNLAAAPLLGMLRNGGVLIQVCSPGGKPEITIPLIPLVAGQKSVVGSFVGGRSDMQMMLELAAVKHVKPMVEIMPISKVNEAFDLVESGKARYRVVLDMQAEKDLTQAE